MEDYVARVRESRKESGYFGSASETAVNISRAHLTELISCENTGRTDRGMRNIIFRISLKKKWAISVKEYILQEKIEQAKVMLTSRNESIQKIRDSLAFGNRSYFYTCFQKQKGMSPSEYRNTKGKKQKGE